MDVPVDHSNQLFHVGMALYILIGSICGLMDSNMNNNPPLYLGGILLLKIKMLQITTNILKYIRQQSYAQLSQLSTPGLQAPSPHTIMQLVKCKKGF